MNMKKILNALGNPKLLIAIGGIFFAIGFIDVEVSGASSISEMLWWGKTAMVGFMSVMAIMIVRFLVLPVAYQIGKVFKKK